MSHESHFSDAVPAQELITFQEYIALQAEAKQPRSGTAPPADAVYDWFSYPFSPLMYMKTMHTSMQYLSGVSERSSLCYFQMAKLALQAFHPVQKPLS